MTVQKPTVPLDEAAAQVRLMAERLALMHLAYARTLIEELGDEKGKALILKAVMEYGRLVGERNRAGKQDLPYYGLHDGYRYQSKTGLDVREIESEMSGGTDWEAFKVYGCVLSKIFKDYGEPELGALYCFVDAAKSMAADPGHKLIHTACELCGDDHCAFDKLPTSEDERSLFQQKDTRWKDIDPLLVKASGMDPDDQAF